MNLSDPYEEEEEDRTNSNEDLNHLIDENINQIQ